MFYFFITILLPLAFLAIVGYRLDRKQIKDNTTSNSCGLCREPNVKVHNHYNSKLCYDCFWDVRAI